MGFSFQYSPLTQKIIDFGGTLTIDNCGLTTVAADNDMGDVILPSMAGTIKYAFLGIKIGALHNTNALNTNWLDGNQYFQVDKAGAGYINAISMADGSLFTPANTIIPCGVIWGSTDIKSRVAFGSTTDVKLASSKAKQNNLLFYGIQPYIRVILE